MKIKKVEAFDNGVAARECEATALTTAMER
jgi:hypothetical protein